jgi:signal transduction histidine kinase
MMPVEKITTVMSYAALGAFAAYMGLWLTGVGHHSYLVPVVSALALNVSGLLVVMAKSGRWFAHSDAGSDRDRTFNARLEESLETARSPRRPHSPPEPAEAARNGDAALIGHEMKNYLCTLKGSASLLRQRTTGQDRDIVDRIDRVVDKLESFTRCMTAPSAATATGLLWHLNMADATRACARTHFHRDADRFRWILRPDAPPLLGDPDRLEQVFLNLYLNALEAGASEVATTVSRAGDELSIAIEDNGKGCACEDLERIFEPFFSTKQGPARRGLGMFIVQSIVENHGGRIQVQSKNDALGGHGLIFTMRFPAPWLSEVARPMRVASINPGKEKENRSLDRLLAVPEPG